MVLHTVPCEPLDGVRDIYGNVSRLEMHGCSMGYPRYCNVTHFDEQRVYRGLPMGRPWATTLNLSDTLGLSMADAWGPPQLRGSS